MCLICVKWVGRKWDESFQAGRFLPAPSGMRCFSLKRNPALLSGNEFPVAMANDVVAGPCVQSSYGLVKLSRGLAAWRWRRRLAAFHVAVLRGAAALHGR